MARASKRLKGNKWQVRWRVGGGSGPMEYIAFPLDEEQRADHAVDLINREGCNISKANVLSVIYNVGLSEIAAMQKEAAEAKKAAQQLPTVRALVEPFLDSKKLKTEPGTRERYRQQIAEAWLPAIGDLRVDLVTDQNIRDVMDSLRKCTCTKTEWGDWCRRRKANKKMILGQPHSAGIEKRTQDKYFSAISGLFTFAAKEFRISSPLAGSGFQRQTLKQYNTVSKEEKHFYLTDQQFALLRSKMPTHIQVMVDLIGETGLRFSEVTGLLKGQFSPKPPFVNLDEVIKKSKELGYYRSPPKNGNPRIIPISVQTAIKIEQLCVDKKLGEYIFTTARGFQITANNFYRDVWDPAVIEAQRCPEHPPASELEYVPFSELDGPRCGDNGGLNARRKPCMAQVVVGKNRCASHADRLARDAVSNCGCDDPLNPRRLPRELTVHDLRHTYHARMLGMNVPIELLSERTGASVDVIRTVYGGIRPDQKNELARLSALPV